MRNIKQQKDYLRSINYNNKKYDPLKYKKYKVLLSLINYKILN